MEPIENFVTPMTKWFVPLTRISSSAIQKNLWALVDTGSNKSYIGQKGLNVIKDWNKTQISLPSFSAFLANGESCIINQALRVPVKLGGKIREITLFYLPELTLPAILGLDEIVKCEMTMSSNSTWWFNESPTTRNSFYPDPSILLTGTSVEGIQVLSTMEENELKKIVHDGICKLRTSPGKTNLISHAIETGDAPPVKLKAYRYSPKVLEEMNLQLDKYLEEEIVEPSHAEWASPVVMIKKNDKYRFCIDFRRINSISKKDSYPMPNMSQLLDGLRQAKYLSKIDLKQAFLQVPLANDHSKDVTSFIVPGRGLYRFNMMPFGLTGSPATFQRLADKVFGPELLPFVVVYLDDLLVCTPDFETHCVMVKEVFKRLKNAGLKINEEKCEFGCTEVRYLGYLVNQDGMCADPERVSSVLDFPSPHNVKTLRSFLGMAGWYRRFIKDFSTLVSPLTQLLKKNIRWEWGQSQEAAFKEIKRLLTSTPILARPDFSLPFTLCTDASNVGLGAVLTQIQNGEERVIAYSSRTLSSAEQNYSVTERECLAVLWGITKYRHYLEGYKFTVVTDHASLRWLLNLKDPTGRLARWALQLQQYDFAITYRKGSSNVVADALSRIPENLVLSISEDPWYTQKYEKVSKCPQNHPDWLIKDNRLYFHRANDVKGDMEEDSEKWKLVVPAPRRAEIFYECHDRKEAGHLGVAKTHWRIARLYYWPGMYQETLRYVRNCPTCQRNKPPNTPPRGQMHTRYVQKPWECVSADIMGPYPPSSEGNLYLLVFQDVFSRWVELVPIRRATAEVIIKKFTSVILNRYGTPSILITDNGTNFVSRKMASLVEVLNIQHLKTPFYHSQANPVERSNRNIKQLIVTYIGKNHRKWDANLGELQLALNSVKQDSTKFSPAFLNFGRELKLSGHENSTNKAIDLRDLEGMSESRTNWGSRMKRLKEVYHLVEENVIRASNNQGKRYNLRRNKENFKVGDRVLKRTVYPSSAGSAVSSKLYPKYEGPFIVVAVSPSGSCQLKSENGKSIGLWHSSKLKIFNQSD